MKLPTLAGVLSFLTAAGAAGVSVVMWRQQAAPSFLASLPLEQAALLVHLTACLAAAVGGALVVPARGAAGRCGLFLLFVLLGFMLPVLGLVLVLGWALILARPGGHAVVAADRFTVGLPVFPEMPPPTAAVEPPLAESLPHATAGEVAARLLALRHVPPTPGALALLRAHAASPEPEVQFVADGVLSGWQDRAERTLRAARTRGDHLRAAEALLALARLSPASEGAPVALGDEALSLLDRAPATAEKARLVAEAHLALGREPAPAGAHASPALAARVAFARRDWAALRRTLAEAAPGEFDAEILAFWNHA